MIIESAPTGAIALSRRFWIARAMTITTAVGLQLVGPYAVAVTFGAWTTFGLYAVGGFAVFLQRVILLRNVPCLPGD